MQKKKNGSSHFCGSTAVMRSILQDCVGEIFQNSTYSLLDVLPQNWLDLKSKLRGNFTLIYVDIVYYIWPQYVILYHMIALFFLNLMKVSILVVLVSSVLWLKVGSFEKKWERIFKSHYKMYFMTNFKFTALIINLYLIITITIINLYLKIIIQKNAAIKTRIHW